VKRTGLIGLGSIGSYFTSKLVGAGYPLAAFDIAPEPVQRAVEQGAGPAGTPGEVADASDVILLALPGSHAVEEVMLGEGGLLPKLRPGQVVIDTGTSLPASHLKLVPLVEKVGARMLDAPITWRSAGLTIMVGGDEATYRECLDVLSVVGAKVRYVGGPGQGQLCKLVNQMVQAGTTSIVAESLVFAAKAGLDLEQVVETLDLEGGARAMLGGDSAGAGQLRLHYKDLGYALAAARDLGTPTPVTALVNEAFKLAAVTGDPSWIQPAVITYWERLAGAQARGREDADRGGQ